MQNTQVENLSLLVEMAKDDPAAFGRLYDHYLQPIYRYIYSRVGTATDAEDLTSQTFIAAYESLPRYRERNNFAAWLFRIARNKTMDHFRRHKRETGLEEAEELIEGEDTLHQLVRDEEIGRMQLLIQKLNPEEQDLIRLRYVANLTFAEIGDLLGRSEQAIKQSVYRLLARLKSQLE